MRAHQSRPADRPRSEPDSLPGGGACDPVLDSSAGGAEIYERDIRAQVEADHHGEYVAIDVNTGCWAIAGELRDAAKRLRAEQPDAIDVWLLRVGHRALYHFGGRPLRRAE